MGSLPASRIVLAWCTKANAKAQAEVDEAKIKVSAKVMAGTGQR